MVTSAVQLSDMYYDNLVSVCVNPETFFVSGNILNLSFSDTAQRYVCLFVKLYEFSGSSEFFRLF